MELRNRTKGQVFVISAVLFSSLAIILFLTTANILPDQTQDTVKKFYENVFQEAPENFNEGLKNNYSIKSVRNEMYGFSRFVERSSNSKGIKFSASYLLMLPQRGKAAFINYRNTEEEIRLYNSENGWDNTSVQPKQYIETNYPSGTTYFRILLPNRGIDRNFTVSSPRILNSMKLTAEDQVWINTRLY